MVTSRLRALSQRLIASGALQYPYAVEDCPQRGQEPLYNANANYSFHLVSSAINPDASTVRVHCDQCGHQDEVPKSDFIHP